MRDQNWTWGLSWMPRIMPYVEQTAGYEQMTFIGDHPGGRGMAAAGNINGLAWQDVKFSVLLCPSTPLETMVDAGGNGIHDYASELHGDCWGDRRERIRQRTVSLGAVL